MTFLISVLGMISPEFSGATAAIVSALKQYKIAAVTFGSTATFLSDTKKYPYLLRTVAADNVQVQVRKSTNIWGRGRGGGGGGGQVILVQKLVGPQEHSCISLCCMDE